MVSFVLGRRTNGLLNKIALAPEREGVEALFVLLLESVTVALGHSNATCQ